MPFKHSTKLWNAFLFEPQRDKERVLFLDAFKLHYDVEATCSNSPSSSIPYDVKSPTPISTTVVKFPLPAGHIN